MENHHKVREELGSFLEESELEPGEEDTEMWKQGGQYERTHFSDEYFGSQHSYQETLMQLEEKNLLDSAYFEQVAEDHNPMNLFSELFSGKVSSIGSEAGSLKEFRKNLIGILREFHRRCMYF